MYVLKATLPFFIFVFLLNGGQLLNDCCKQTVSFKHLSFEAFQNPGKQTEVTKAVYICENGGKHGRMHIHLFKQEISRQLCQDLNFFLSGLLYCPYSYLILVFMTGDKLTKDRSEMSNRE